MSERRLTDCGFRIEEGIEKPCVHCSKPTTGRNENGTVSTCYRCYHNVSYNCNAARCGESVRSQKDDSERS